MVFSITEIVILRLKILCETINIKKNILSSDMMIIAISAKTKYDTKDIRFYV